MYIDNGELTPALRQGDIISSVHILGAINLKTVQYTATSDGIGKSSYQSWQVPKPPEFLDAMVLSHSCEIAIENKVKLTSIILAPVRDIHTATSSERIEELIASNLIDKDEPRASYLKYFYLEPNPGFQFERGAVVDFSKCFSVRKQAYDMLLEKKVAELQKEFRLSMALKLSLYFYRTQEPNAA
jgi:hypothetical protein